MSRSANQILNDVIEMEAFADQIKIKAAGLRKELVRLSGPAPSGAKKKSDADTKARIIGRTRKTILKRSA